MEEQNRGDTTGNHFHSLYFVKFPLSPAKIQKKEFEKQYHLLNRDQIRITGELAQKKVDEYQIEYKLMWISHLDTQIEWKTTKIKYLEDRYQDTVNLRLPVNSVPRSTGSICLSGIDAEAALRPDIRRCQKWLIKKGRMDIEYLRQVQEEHVSSNIRGTQELNAMVQSMIQRIQHGNKKRADEMKLNQEMRSFKETKQTIIARESDPQSPQCYTRKLHLKRDMDEKRSLKHKINIRLEDIEQIKRQQIGRGARVRRLKADLEYVRKGIMYLNKKLKDVNSKMLEAYKRAYASKDQKKELNSSYNEYQSFRKYVKKLARKGDVSGLKSVCDTQVEGFMRQRNDSEAFREDYEKRKLVWPITQKTV